MASIPQAFGVVYLIHNTVSHAVYVGITTQAVRQRWQHHKYMLNHTRHDNPHLQHAWNKYGRAAFEFVVIDEAATEAELNESECWHLAYLRSLGVALYNQKSGGGFGGKWSEAMRQKASAAKLGKGKSAETRQRMSDAMRGVSKNVSPEGRARSQAASRKAMQTPEHRELRRQLATGRTHTDEARNRMSEVQSQLHGITYYLTGPDGAQYITNNLARFCQEHGLNKSSIKNLFNGPNRVQQYRGWTGRKETK